MFENREQLPNIATQGKQLGQTDHQTSRERTKSLKKLKGISVLPNFAG